MKRFYLVFLSLLLVYTAKGQDYIDKQGVEYEQTEEGQCEVVGWPEDIENLVIPQSVSFIDDDGERQHWKVMSVTSCEFEDNEYIRSIKFPEELDGIEGLKATNCPKLSSVTFPNLLRTMGSLEIMGCDKLSNIILPSSTTIDDFSIYSLPNLTNLTVPNVKNTTHINAFPALASVHISQSNRVEIYSCPALSSISINKADDIAIYLETCPVLSSLSIKQAKTISISGREAKELTTLTLPSSVSGGSISWEGATSLTAIDLPQGLSSINLTNCTALTAIDVPASVTDVCFSGCSSVKSIALHEGITSIGYEAFTGCSSLTSLRIPNSVQELRASFKDCTSLHDIYVGSLSLFLNAYAEIPSEYYLYVNDKPVTELTQDSEHGGLLGLSSLDNCQSLKSLTYAEGVEYPSRLKNCHNLEEVYLSSTVVEVPGFKGCDNLKRIVVSPNHPRWDSRDNCNAIIETASNKMILGCGGTTFPTSVHEIGSMAFTAGSSVKDFVIGEPVTTIGAYAFMLCDNLETISLPNSLTTIGVGAFSGCDKLKEVVIPESVQTIGQTAFYSCAAMERLTIGKGVKTMGAYAFMDCNALKEIYCLAETPTAIDEGVFSTGRFEYGTEKENEVMDIIYDNATLFVPVGSKALYQNARGWKKFKNIVETEFTAIECVNGDMPQSSPITRYDLAGRRIATSQRGIHIVRMSDGTTRKVAVK